MREKKKKQKENSLLMLVGEMRIKRMKMPMKMIWDEVVEEEDEKKMRTMTGFDLVLFDEEHHHLVRRKVKVIQVKTMEKKKVKKKVKEVS